MDAGVRERTLPLARPLGTAEGEITARPSFLLRIERGGAAGVGEAAPLPPWTESVDDCRTALEAAVDHLAGGAPTEALAAVDDAPAAAHALRLAVHDRAAREAGHSLAAELGDATATDRVPVNATLGDDDVEGTVDAAETAVARGFDCLKVKVGARSLEADVERLRAVRDAVGESVVLRADANRAWDRATAREAVDAFAAVGVAYVEEPLAGGDLDALSALRDTPVGIAVDETLREQPLAAVLDADAADAAVLKPMALGGVRQTVEVARRARGAGVDPVVTTTVDGVVARTAAVHAAAAIPATNHCGLATADRLAEDWAADPAPVLGGEMRVPTEPGTGVEGAWGDPA